MLALPSCIGGLRPAARPTADDLHQRHRRDAAGIAGEAGRQRRAADGRSRGGLEPGHADGTLAARAAQGRLAGDRRPSRSSPTSATRSPWASPSPTASSISRPWRAASSSPSIRPRARSSRRSTSGRSGRVPPFRAAASTRHRQHAFHPIRLRGLLPQEVHGRALLVRLAGRRRSQPHGRGEGVGKPPHPRLPGHVAGHQPDGTKEQARGLGSARRGDQGHVVDAQTRSRSEERGRSELGVCGEQAREYE